MTRLQDQVAIITGGARGQGAEEARLFAAEGAAVAICDVLDAEGEDLARNITASGGQARFFRLDVTSEDQWVHTIAQVVAWKGKVSILINNAGIINQLGVLETPIDLWRKVMDVNITGPFLGIKHAAPAMAAAGGGSIINISSTAAYMGVKCAAYVSSKTGLLGLTRTAATELAEMGVRVNAICPGVIATDMGNALTSAEAMRQATPMRRHGTVQDVAKMALYLASADSAYVTGAEMLVDGGYVAAGAMKLVRRLVNHPEAVAAIASD
jgi:3alpha(or 20beta)-hydroxysteroid dehydrogenase